MQLQSICSTTRLQAIIEVATLLDVCCKDDLCPKARSLVLTDRHVLPALGQLLGDLLFASQGDLTEMGDEFLKAGTNTVNKNKNTSAHSDESITAWRLIVQLATAVASITHSATFGPAHSVSTTKTGVTHMGAEMGGVVLAMSAALHLSSIRSMVQQAGWDLLACGGGDTPISLSLMEFDRMSHATMMTGCVGALVGLSQLEPVRPFFALPLPLPNNDQASAVAGTTKPTKSTNKPDSLGRPFNTNGAELTPVHVLLGVLTGQTDHRSNCLAILMNASLDLSAPQTAATITTSNNNSDSPSLPSVKETIVKAGGMTVALSGISLRSAQRSPSPVSSSDSNSTSGSNGGGVSGGMEETEPSYFARTAGLLARLITVPAAQEVLSQPDHYRALCRALGYTVQAIEDATSQITGTDVTTLSINTSSSSVSSRINDATNSTAATTPISDALPISDEVVKYLTEEQSHMVRALGSLNKPSEKCLAIAREELLVIHPFDTSTINTSAYAPNLSTLPINTHPSTLLTYPPPTHTHTHTLTTQVQTLILLFPSPREELGEITPTSVILPPRVTASPLLLGTLSCLLLINTCNLTRHNAALTITCC